MGLMPDRNDGVLRGPKHSGQTTPKTPNVAVVDRPPVRISIRTLQLCGTTTVFGHPPNPPNVIIMTPNSPSHLGEVLLWQAVR